MLCTTPPHTLLDHHDVLHPTFHIRGHSHVDFFGVRQPQILHQFNVFIHWFGQTTVIFVFMANRRPDPTFVIVPWVHDGTGGQRKQYFVHGAVQGFTAAFLKIGSAAAIDQQAIPGKDHAHVRFQKRHATVGVPRRRECFEGAGTIGPFDLLPVFQCHIGIGTRRCRNDGTQLSSLASKAKKSRALEKRGDTVSSRLRVT